MANETEELESLLRSEIPRLNAQPLNHFKISGIEHYENISSNWYAFFFDTKTEHGFQDLFISSLTQLIKDKSGKEIRFNGCRAEREVPTLKGGRLDILY